MPDELTILYRGPLSSCNYDCWYCPFAKVHENAAELKEDQSALERFTEWCITSGPRQLFLFFTPWGECLHRKWYQSAFVQLSRFERIRKVAVQTNLATSLNWIAECDVSKLGFWCTFHPSETSQEEFLSQCEKLRSYGVQHSVGVVGIRENFAAIENLRRTLPANTYLWINAYKDEGDYYTKADVDFLRSIDPHFEANLTDYPSYGKACRTGKHVISVDGAGDIRRCHFIKDVIGNLYEANWDDCLRETLCTRSICDCHIGYVHLEGQKFDAVYGDGLLERVPVSFQKIQQLS